MIVVIEALKVKGLGAFGRQQHFILLRPPLLTYYWRASVNLTPTCLPVHFRGSAYSWLGDFDPFRAVLLRLWWGFRA